MASPSDPGLARESTRAPLPLELPDILRSKMGRPCLVCTHPDLEKIEALLLQAGHNISELSDTFQISRASIQSHRDNHLPVRLLRVAEAAAKVIQEKKDLALAHFALAHQKNRMGRLQSRWDALDRVVEKRKAKANPDIPGDDEGILVDGKVDRALLSEERAIHRAAAIETGEFLAQMGRAQFGMSEQGQQQPMMLVMNIGLGATPPAPVRHQVRVSRKRNRQLPAEQPTIDLSKVDIEQKPEYVEQTREQSLSGEAELDDYESFDGEVGGDDELEPEA